LKKLRLELEMLEVQSFVTDAETGGEPGTVRGRMVVAETEGCAWSDDYNQCGGGSGGGGVTYDCPYTQRYYSCDPAACGTGGGTQYTCYLALCRTVDC
jgi:hypothetical protein